MLYFLVGLVVFILGYFVALPLLTPEKAASQNATADAQNANAHTAKEAIEQTLADLEFDHATGKIGDDEYENARLPLVAQIPVAQESNEQAEPAVINEWEMEILIARARRKK